MSSRFEGFALVLLEAKAFGLPIVSFDIKNGPNEIVQNGVNGYIVPAFDISIFAESLKVLMKDDKLRAHFTDDSQRNMYQFSKDRIVANWIQLLEELTEQKETYKNEHNITYHGGRNRQPFRNGN